MRTTAIFTALVALAMTAQAMPPPQMTDLAPHQGSVVPHQNHAQRGEYAPALKSVRPPPKGEPQPKRGEQPPPPKSDARPPKNQPDHAA